MGALGLAKKWLFPKKEERKQHGINSPRTESDRNFLQTGTTILGQPVLRSQETRRNSEQTNPSSTNTNQGKEFSQARNKEKELSLNSLTGFTQRMGGFNKPGVRGFIHGERRNEMGKQRGKRTYQCKDNPRDFEEIIHSHEDKLLTVGFGPQTLHWEKYRAP